MASGKPRQDVLPFSISFRGAIPFPGDLPREAAPLPRLTGDIEPDQLVPSKVDAEETRALAQWSLKCAEKLARRLVVHLTDGWLIGFGAGEFGGSLWWYTSPDFGRRIAEGNVVDIVPVGEGREALVFGGLAHADTDEGRVFRFTSSNGRPGLRVVSDLDASPRIAVAESHDAALVLTTKRLLPPVPIIRETGGLGRLV